MCCLFTNVSRIILGFMLFTKTNSKSQMTLFDNKHQTKQFMPFIRFAYTVGETGQYFEGYMQFLPG